MVVTLLFSPYALLVLPFLFYFLPYLRNRLIRNVPGPLVARFSNLWLLYQSRRGRRYLAVDAAHKRYGPVVRIQPDHVSIADSEAIPIIYSHTGGWTKRYLSYHPVPRGIASANRVDIAAITMMPSFLSAVAFSILVTERSILANGRPSPTPSAPSPSPNSNPSSRRICKSW